VLLEVLFLPPPLDAAMATTWTTTNAAGMMKRFFL